VLREHVLRGDHPAELAVAEIVDTVLKAQQVLVLVYVLKVPAVQGRSHSRRISSFWLQLFKPRECAWRDPSWDRHSGGLSATYMTTKALDLSKTSGFIRISVAVLRFLHRWFRNWKNVRWPEPRTDKVLRIHGLDEGASLLCVR
jgi:hypothetical protein